MMSPQCSTCGAYFTGQETVCQRCGTPRVSNPYQTDSNPYQQNPYQTQQPNQGVYGAGNVNAQQNFLQRYYTPERIVRRAIIGRIIGLGIVAFMFLACAAYCLLAGGLAALTNH